MEVAECTKITLNRIQQIEPENATKIIGYLLLNHTSEEIIEYAFGPDKQIISLIDEAKAYLKSSSRQHVTYQSVPNQHMPFSPTITRPSSSPSSFHVQAPHLDPHLTQNHEALNHKPDIPPHLHADLVGYDCYHHTDAQFISMEEQLNQSNALETDFLGNCYYPEAGLRANASSPTGMRVFPIKTCHYFNNGYCQNGINCKYFHGQGIPDSVSQTYNLNFNEMVEEEHLLVPGSLEKLEIKIMELLREKNGMPVSIASLPMMYLERYGKTLQAEGYLTESQPHERADLRLTQMLSQLKNSIHLIERPHGQLSVILAEDAPKYMMGYRNERIDPVTLASSSHQIYLTFPAESTFSNDDVSNYFKQFGPVHDVRIPRQEKRMFGFVSFLYAETVSHILSKGFPHYICGSRVLAKPYKEKSQLLDRKCSEKIELPMYHPSPYFEVDPELNTMPRLHDNSKLLKQQLMEEHIRAVELETRHLLEMHLNPNSLVQQPHLGCRVEELKFPEDNFGGVLNNGSSDDQPAQSSNNDSDQDRYMNAVIDGHHELPDSPF